MNRDCVPYWRAVLRHGRFHSRQRPALDLIGGGNPEHSWLVNPPLIILDTAKYKNAGTGSELLLPVPA